MTAVLGLPADLPAFLFHRGQLLACELQVEKLGADGDDPDGVAQMPELLVRLALVFQSVNAVIMRRRQDQAGLTLARLTNSVERSVVTARRRILAGQARIAAARREVEAATENLQLVETRRGAGAEILLTVLDAQSALTRAQTALVAAVAEHNAAQYALLRAVGGL